MSPGLPDAPATRRWLPAAAAAALAVAVWLPALGGELQYDDLPGLVLDPATRDPAALAARLASGVRPLTRLSFFLESATWGQHARGALAVNLVLHAASALLVLALARRRLAGGWPALAAAGLFAAAPSQGMVVAYASGRSAGLATALLLAALWLHERAGEAGRRPWAWTGASLLAAALAALARETALVFPLLLAGWEWTRPPPRRWRAVLPAAALAAALALALAALPRYRELAAFSLEHRTPLEALAVNVAALPELVSLWVRPWALSIDHAVPAPPAPARIALAGAALAAALAAAALARRRAPLLALGLLWAVVALVPTHSLVAKLDVLDEKPLYLALVGPALAFGALAAWARGYRAGRPLVLAALACLAAAGWTRAAVFADPRRLWADAAAKAPAKARPWNNLGVAHWERGDVEAAREAFERAMMVEPGYGPAEVNLRRLELLEGRRR